MQPFNEQTPKNFLFIFQLASLVKKKMVQTLKKILTWEIRYKKKKKKLNEKVPSTTVERKSKVKSLTNFRKLVSGSDGAAPINGWKYFNRLVLFAQREDNLESSLGFYELTLIAMSLFSEKD